MNETAGQDRLLTSGDSNKSAYKPWRWPDLWDAETDIVRLEELGVPELVLEPVRAWVAEQTKVQDAYHQRHLEACGITDLGGHGYGWANCPNFICRHCGSPPDADGDHTCPCPNRDEDCTEHPIPSAS